MAEIRLLIRLLFWLSSLSHESPDGMFDECNGLYTSAQAGCCRIWNCSHAPLYNTCIGVVIPACDCSCNNFGALNRSHATPLHMWHNRSTQLLALDPRSNALWGTFMKTLQLTCGRYWRIQVAHKIPYAWHSWVYDCSRRTAQFRGNHCKRLRDKSTHAKTQGEWRTQ